MFIEPLSEGLPMAVLMVFTLIVCSFAILKLGKFLPSDRGREFAFQAEKSAGKKTSTGIIFISVFVAVTLIAVKLSWEIRFYIIAVFIEMMTGYLDDNSKKPWGELTKGLLDFAVASFIAVVYIMNNGTMIRLALFSTDIQIPVPILFFLIIVLNWVSINVTNITDGVDSLSARLGTVTLLSSMLAAVKLGTIGEMKPVYLVFLAVLFVYLYFNAIPSSHLMGDAGSRAMGVFISIALLKTGSPFLYIPFAFVFIADGASSLMKLSFIRYLKMKNFMKDIQTPLHDHYRKKIGWANEQAVTRFVLLQLIVSIVILLLI
ncbi:hypothetical protein ACTQ46_09290 [Gallicola sp. Sow4_E12]|uniref:hypothetical protein n=1 Tax=Gallicola sp. Sow4_E12 TaxID=3438785 RepID=UPI003F93406E